MDARMWTALQYKHGQKFVFFLFKFDRRWFDNFQFQLEAMPRITSMSDEGNRAQVFGKFDHYIRRGPLGNGPKFLHRRDYLTFQQVAEIDQVVNRLRTSAARASMQFNS